MGQRFYEAKLPKIADQLERLNANLDAFLAELREDWRLVPPNPAPQLSDESQ
jgi:hypothetical protein